MLYNGKWQATSCMAIGIILLLRNARYGAVSATSPLSLAGGRYEASTEVLKEACIALDAAGMRGTVDVRDKMDIYLNGYQEEGRPEDKPTLASLSQNAGRAMAANPLYESFVYTFQVIGFEEEGEPMGIFDDMPAEQYANTIVMDLFDINKPNLEAEAALVMNLWMAVVHELCEAARTCNLRTSEDNDSGARSLDRAAAFWIGLDQQHGDSETGSLLYNLAEQVGERFGQEGDDGETEVNRRIIDLMNDIKTNIINTNMCAQGSTGYVEFRSLVNQIIRYMTVLLIQQLICHLAESKDEPSDRAFISLYTLSFLPRVHTCDSILYKTLLHSLVLNAFDSNPNRFITTHLQRAYSCLGISCEDVGSYKVDVVPGCTDAADSHATDPLL